MSAALSTTVPTVVLPSCRVTLSPTTAAVPSLALVLKLTCKLGTLTWLLASTLRLGAAGEIVSSAWLCAATTAAALAAASMALAAPRMAVCSEPVIVVPASMLASVPALARSSVPPALSRSVARLWYVMMPFPAFASSARVTVVAICAATFCAVSDSWGS